MMLMALVLQIAHRNFTGRSRTISIVVPLARTASGPRVSSIPASPAVAPCTELAVPAGCARAGAVRNSASALDFRPQTCHAFCQQPEDT